MPSAVRTGLIMATLCLSFLAGQAVTAAWATPTGGAVYGEVGPTAAKAGAAEQRTFRASPRRAALLERIAECESGDDPTAVSADGLYRGKYQFSRPTWRAMGGSGDPAAAPEVEQDRRAAKLLRQEGLAPWPHCGAQAR